jgi:hypothetical protein
MRSDAGAHVGAWGEATELLADDAVGPAAMRSEAGAHVGVRVRSPQREDAVSKLDAATLGAQAKAALTGLGWKPAIAHAAVAAAMAQTHEFTLERLIYESLRRCPMPRA